MLKWVEVMNAMQVNKSGKCSTVFLNDGFQAFLVYTSGFKELHT